MIEPRRAHVPVLEADVTVMGHPDLPGRPAALAPPGPLLTLRLAQAFPLRSRRPAAVPTLAGPDPGEPGSGGRRTYRLRHSLPMW